MADALFSAISEAKESVTEGITSSISVGSDGTITVTPTDFGGGSVTETVKTEAAAAQKEASGLTTEVAEAITNSVSVGADGTITVTLPNLGGAVTDAVSGASSSTVASRDLPVSTDNQPLLASSETTPVWKNCCGVLDLFKKDTTN